MWLSLERRDYGQRISSVGTRVSAFDRAEIQHDVTAGLLHHARVLYLDWVRAASRKKLNTAEVTSITRIMTYDFASFSIGVILDLADICLTPTLASFKLPPKSEFVTGLDLGW